MLTFWTKVSLLKSTSSASFPGQFAGLAPADRQTNDQESLDHGGSIEKGSMKDYRLADLLDMRLIQNLADANFRASGLPMSIVDAFDKAFLVRAGWTDLCMKFHRASPDSNQICRESDAAVQEHLVPGEAYRYRCKLGLWHVAMPIMVAGQHLATMFMTQFGVEGDLPDREFFLQQAQKFAFERDAYLVALDQLPVFSLEKVKDIISYDKALVQFLSDLAEQSLELKRFQEELEDKVQGRTAELAEANAFMANIFDNTIDTIGIADQHGNLTSWNKAAEEMYGYTFAELQDKKAFELYADRDALDRMLNQLRRDGFVKHYEIDMRKKDGTILPCSLSIRILRDKNQKTVGSVTVSRDLTETKANLANFKAANEQLQTLVREAEERNRQMALLQEMNDFFRSCQTPEENYEAIAHYTPKFFPGYGGSLYVFNNTENFYEMVANWGETAALEPLFGQDDCWALRRHRLIFVKDPPSALNCPHVSSALPNGYLCVPLIAQGKELGILHLQSLSAELTERLNIIEPFIKPLAEAISMALANLQLRESLKNQAIRDSLTGLYNRRYLNETIERELSRSRRLGSPMGVILMDLDNFKEYNDLHAHDSGDELLEALGKLILWQTRKEDIACRYGGEEFLIIMPGASLETTLGRSRDLHQHVQQLHLQYRHLHPVTVSVGVAAYPDHARSGKEICRAAEAALQRAKDEGRDRIVAVDGDILGKDKIAM
jgi:diguanylate cyclase (GGDEF)-like protein/PAS domain S-box-containing protein